jgi:hypothetical protein
LIAAAIDAKSRYTGGHCARVPELTKMLARAACAADERPYKDFVLSEDDWEALHVAAWLHDCGKVTTPEYVVDKATKLETIHDRIHEVRMRFEVLKRDAEISCLQGDRRRRGRAFGARRLARVAADSTTTSLSSQACNEGGEFMAAAQHRAPADDRRANLAAHARRPHRHLARRETAQGADAGRGAAGRRTAARRQARAPLPAARAGSTTGRQPLGLSDASPALLYNRGELYNLAVGRGTLSAEERYKINEHIVQTLIMLSQLPFRSTCGRCRRSPVATTRKWTAAATRGDCGATR